VICVTSLIGSTQKPPAAWPGADVVGLLGGLHWHQVDVTTAHPHRAHAQVLGNRGPGLAGRAALLNQLALGLPLGGAARINIGGFAAGFFVVLVAFVMVASYRRSGP
jgi:hypothetical protein